MIQNFKIQIILFLFLTVTFNLNSQTKKYEPQFTNETLLYPIFEKLYKLESEDNGKINIVHIGDSHIQGDFFTNVIRQALQGRFGNGGYGFSFPYKLIKTNSNNYITYTSNIAWDSQRNIYPVKDVSVGLSGIGFYTKEKMFQLDINTTTPYLFDKIKVLYPTKRPQFKITEEVASDTQLKAAPEKKIVSVESVTHKVKARETLSQIAKKYKVTVNDIKKLNGLKSNNIRIGAVLKIKKVTKTKTQEIKFDPVVFKNIDFLNMVNDEKYAYCSVFQLPQLTGKVSIFPNSDNKSDTYSLSGVVLENNLPGVIYHVIGVNGAKVSDYNKYPLFFEQLPALEPDLVIVSLGTNESFGKWATPYFITQMKSFVDQVKAKNPNTIVLLMSPPPSAYRKGALNPFIEDYAQALAQMNGCVFWNLLDKLGGAEAAQDKAFLKNMAKDKVHYTIDGYQNQGRLFLNDFISAYDNYVKRKTIGKNN